MQHRQGSTHPFRPFLSPPLKPAGWGVFCLGRQNRCRTIADKQSSKPASKPMAFLSGISSFNKTALKPTTIHVRQRDGKVALGGSVRKLILFSYRYSRRNWGAMKAYKHILLGSNLCQITSNLSRTDSRRWPHFLTPSPKPRGARSYIPLHADLQTSLLSKCALSTFGSGK